MTFPLWRYPLFVSLARRGNHPHPRIECGAGSSPLPSTGEGIRGFTAESAEDVRGEVGEIPVFVAFGDILGHFRYGS